MQIGRLTAISGDILNEQCFRYEYDGRKRMIMKKVPGAGAVYLVYDARNRLVFTQDSLLRSQNKWLTVLYDQLNRAVITGLMTFSGGIGALQNSVNNKTVTPGSPNAGLHVDLVLDTSNQSGAKEALRSITMEDGFETTTSGTFSADIVTGPGGPDGETMVLEGVEVNKSPIPIGASL